MSTGNLLEWRASASKPVKPIFPHLTFLGAVLSQALGKPNSVYVYKRDGRGEGGHNWKLPVF